MYTYQDFAEEKSTELGIINTINHHKNTEMYKIAMSADNYDRQRNETILNYIKRVYSILGIEMEDFTASNNKICSNFFHRLNTQRCEYLLGNGVSFTDNIKTEVQQDGTKKSTDMTKESLGNKFDHAVKEIAYNALIHGLSFGFWNVDQLHMFPLTEFAPLWDEDTGALRAGVRFWQIAKDKPIIAVLYEEDGYSKWKSNDKGEFIIVDEKRSYQQTISVSEEGGSEVIGEENYGSLPIVPMWGSSLHQSTLVGMREKIDSYDLISSGFANDLEDVAQVYWLINNANGMTDEELEQFRDRLKILHIAKADTANSSVTPFVQEIPFQARKEYLEQIRSSIYEDFGGLDVHTISAGATNDHIDAGYQPLDEESDDYEYQVTEFIEQILKLMGIEDEPVYKRNKISNYKEQTEMVLSAGEYLDDETVLKHIPWITVDEVSEILARKDMEASERFTDAVGMEEEAEETESQIGFRIES